MVREDFQKKILKSKGVRVGGREEQCGQGNRSQLPSTVEVKTVSAAGAQRVSEHGLGGQRRKQGLDLTWPSSLQCSLS